MPLNRVLYEFSLGLRSGGGEGMSMRLDGTLLGMSPFETEIHRSI